MRPPSSFRDFALNQPTPFPMPRLLFLLSGSISCYKACHAISRLAQAKIEDRCFYDLRRTFQTVAEGARDLAAAQAIMGHAPPASDMSALYRQRVDDDRLRAVVDHVHNWLFVTEARLRAK